MASAKVVDWNCAFDEPTHTNCTITAPYTESAAAGRSPGFAYAGSGPSPFTANSISPGSDLVTFGLLPGGSGSITVSLTESTGVTVPPSTPSPSFSTFRYLLRACGYPCSIGPVGLTPGAIISGTVHGTFDATPVIRTSQGVISASGYGALSAIAPGTWMEIYGTNLANVNPRIWGSGDFTGNNAPTALGGTTVTVGGQSAFVDYVSPNQVNAQVPSNIGSGPQKVIVTTPGGTSAAYTVTVNQVEPGLLALPLFNVNGAQYVTALFPDGATFVAPPGSISGVTSVRARPGDTIVFYGIGFGSVTPNIPAGQLVTQANSVAFRISIGGRTRYRRCLCRFDRRWLASTSSTSSVIPPVPASDSVPVTFSLGGTAGTQKLQIAISN